MNKIELGSGWRARIGYTMTHTNTTIERETWAVASRLQGISFHIYRLRIDEVTLAGQQGMIDHVEEGVRILAGMRPDLIVYGPSIGSMQHGLGWDKQLTEKMEQFSRNPYYTLKDPSTKYKEGNVIPCYTTGTAILDALQKLEAHSISLSSPHIIEFDRVAKLFLEANGIQVKLGKCLNINDNTEIGNLPTNVAYKVVKQGDQPGTDAHVTVCANFPTFDVIDMLERDLGKPVIPCNLAMIWGSLRKLGIRDRLDGFGCLLREN